MFAGGSLITREFAFVLSGLSFLLNSPNGWHLYSSEEMAGTFSQRHGALTDIQRGAATDTFGWLRSI